MILVDGDVLVYRTGYAAQKTSYQFARNSGDLEELGELTQNQAKNLLKSRGVSQHDGKLQKVITPEPVENACYLVKHALTALQEKFNGKELKVLLSSNDKSNYRYEIAKMLPYKGNRTQPRPVHYEALREYMVGVWGAEIINGKEADDELGILQCSNGEDSVICTVDKDLDMIPGMHYNFITGELYETRDPGHLELSSNHRKVRGGGIKWFYAQMLLGDRADNIPGICGLGPVRAHELLALHESEEEMARLVMVEYEKQYFEGAYEVFMEVADLLWIQRAPGQRKSDELRKILGEGQ